MQPRDDDQAGAVLRAGATSVPVAGVLLDMDGTLVDSNAAVERQWRTFLTWYDLPESALPRPLHGKRAEDHIRTMLPADLVPEGVARFAELELADLDGIVPVAGAPELLRALDRAAVPWAVVTSGAGPVVAARLAAAGLPSPQVLVTADDVSAGKPDPQPYRLGRERLGVDGPVVAFEDAPAGIASALEAGCAVIAVSTTHDAADLDGAVAVLPDLGTVEVIASGGPATSGGRADQATD